MDTFSHGENKALWRKPMKNKLMIAIMLILFRKGDKAKPHFHTIEEYNFIIKGKLEILFYNKQGKLYKKHIAKKK